MKIKKLFGLCVTMLMVGMVGVFTCPAHAGGTSVSKASDQTALEVTVYNNNLGLVKDRRHLAIPPGTLSLSFMDVAEQINPATVYIRSLTSPGSLAVLEQNYEYDLLNPARLLDKYVGQEVKLYSRNPYTDKEETVTARVLSNAGGSPVFQIGSEITFGHPGRIIFPRIPDNLISRPSLIWLLKNDFKGKAQDIEVAYLTGGMSWRADYVLVLDEEDRLGNLSGWVTVNNQSGATYANATLKLVAGDVNRVPEYRNERVARGVMMDTAAAPQFQEESFFEYHLYSLQHPTTLKERSTKQISLLTAPEIQIKKEYRLNNAGDIYYEDAGDRETRRKVSVSVEFKNTEANKMGMPLPKGIIRTYKYDKSNSLQFTGEDTIQHTPKDEAVRLKLGDVFDVVATSKQTDWKKISKDTSEASFKVTIRNHKNEDIQILLSDSVPGDWRIMESSHKAVKASSSLLEMTVPVGKAGETVATYRVRMRF